MAVTESRGGGRAGADAERQRERQRHGADGQARHDVLEELVGVIAGKFGAKIAEKGRKHTHPPGQYRSMEQKRFAQSAAAFIVRCCPKILHPL